MLKRTSLILVGAAFAAFCAQASAVPALDASTEKVLYDFCSVSGCADGMQPGGPIFDTTGNLYGTTTGGGANNSGTVFLLTPGGNGAWTESVIYSFCSAPNCTDGLIPHGTLTFDAIGNLYGMTQEGGASGSACGGHGCGTVFELTPDGNGTWTETVLHNFDDDGKDGVEPLAGVTVDAAGSLYGTTYSGGAHGGGIVFELTPGSNGTSTETVLHNFCSAHGCDGHSQLTTMRQHAALEPEVPEIAYPESGAHS
jgi:uncharacterized repeat protein (TIGR03803 family)